MSKENDHNCECSVCAERYAQLRCSAATEDKMTILTNPEDTWDAYCAETPEEGRSPQGAMAFAIDRLHEALADSTVGEPQAVATPAFDALATEVIDRISERYNKLAASPLGMATAWERKASGGKPLLYGGKRGLLASGTIATWDEFDLIADVINNLPTLLAACSVSRPK